MMALMRRLAPFLHRSRQMAVLAAVSEVNYLADDQPDQQTQPVVNPERVHHGGIPEDADNRDQRNQRRLERAGGIGILAPHHPYPRTDNHEREQRADARHVPHYRE